MPLAQLGNLGGLLGQIPGLGQALAPVGQALAPAVAPLKQAFAPLTNQLQAPQAANPTFNMLQNTFASPQLSQLSSILQGLPGIEQMRAQFQQGMSPVASQLLNRIHQNSGNGQPFSDWFNNTGFPGMFAGHMRWPPELSQRLFAPQQGEMLKQLYEQARGRAQMFV